MRLAPSLAPRINHTNLSQYTKHPERGMLHRRAAVGARLRALPEGERALGLIDGRDRVEHTAARPKTDQLCTPTISQSLQREIK